MSTRPAVSPALVATVTEDAPGRVRRKLDKTPDAAESWAWKSSGDRWTIEAGGETVELTAPDGVVNSFDQIACSCLLSPRCYHLLACLSVMPLANGNEEESGESDSPQVETEPIGERPALSEPQTKAAAFLWEEAAKLVATGVRSAGSLSQAHLMRALHECRSVGLHRLSAVGLRVLQQIRQLRSDDDEFNSDTLVTDLLETLELAWRLKTAEESPADWIGTARRAYSPIESLSLQALFTEPILTASGHAGVVTYLMDVSQTIYSVSNVRPGEPSRVFEAWKTGIDVGGLSCSHQELSRSGLLLQRGTVSADGRLGAGQNTRAITKTSGGWDSLQSAFEVDLDDQIAHVFEAARASLVTRRAGWDLVFLRGHLAGTDGESLLFQTESGRSVLLSVEQTHEALAFHHNLSLLSRCPGLRLSVIGRLLPEQAGQVSALAIAPLNDAESDHGNSADRAALVLKKPLTDHVSLGIEKLSRGNLSTAEREPVQLTVEPPDIDDGLFSLHRRVRELALNGRHSLPTRGVTGFAREAATLKAQSQPTASALLQNLASHAVASESSLSGLRFPADPNPLAQMWLACAKYATASRFEFQKSLWSPH
ncbi:MAG: hypothetical protein H8E37_00635 [Planctomycetes bacterium]|nr:hypothetical protein [Planctomycetota bacterium]